MKKINNVKINYVLLFSNQLKHMYFCSQIIIQLTSELFEHISHN